MLSPAAGLGPRFSIPFFQGVSYDATFESVVVPEWVVAMARERRGGEGRKGRMDEEVEFTFVKGRWGHLGEATLMNRVKSHQDVGERWYPELLRKIREEQREAEVGSGKGEGEEEKEGVGMDEGSELGVGLEDIAHAIEAH